MPAKKVLVPVDGSENSFRALDQAFSIAKGGGAEITAMHVMEHPPTVYVESQKLLDQLMSKYRQESAKILDRCEELAEKNGLKIETVLAEGDPASNIIAYAEKDDFDMIVIGSRGHGKLMQMVVGSVSSKVLHHAKCSVLLVR